MVAKKQGGTIDLLVENYKKISHLHVVLVPGCTEIGGPNGAGKSSGLNAVSNLFGGAKLTPPEPVHEGAEGYELSMKLNELGLALSRTGVLQEDGSLKEEFVVTPLEGVAEGQAQPRPKALLDKLMGSHSMVLKPLIEMSNADRIALLQRCAGLDFTELDAKHAEIYSQRTDINRATESLKNRLEAMPSYPDTPKLLVSVADLMAELEQQREDNAENDRIRRDLDADNDRLEVAAGHHAYLVNVEEAAWAAVEVAQKAAEEAKQIAEKAKGLLGSDREANKILRNNVASLKDFDLDPLNSQIAGSEEVNNQIKANLDRDDVASKLVASKDEGVKLTGKLREIDDEKKKLLADAKIPGGLSWEDGVVRLKNKPLEQASQVEQMDVDIAISIAQNPDVPIILVNQGSLYDRVHRGKLDKVAKKHGVYVFFERVIDTEEEAKAEGVAVFMRDGTGINLDEESQDG